MPPFPTNVCGFARTPHCTYFSVLVPQPFLPFEKTLLKNAGQLFWTVSLDVDLSEVFSWLAWVCTWQEYQKWGVLSDMSYCRASDRKGSVTCSPGLLAAKVLSDYTGKDSISGRYSRYFETRWLSPHSNLLPTNWSVLFVTIITVVFPFFPTFIQWASVKSCPFSPLNCLYPYGLMDLDFILWVIV